MPPIRWIGNNPPLINADATREEVAAALATAISLNAGAAYIYSMHALEAYDALKK